MAKMTAAGFTLVEALLLLVIVAIIGGTGVYVYHAKHSATNSYTAADKSGSSLQVVTAPSSSTKSATSRSAVTNGDVIISVYSKVPSDLQTAIVTKAKSLAPDCLPGSTAGGDPSVKYMLNAFAVTPIGCDGGANVLFAKTAGAWKTIDQTQDLFSCNAITTYKVPTSFLQATDPQGIAQCFAADGSIKKL